MGIAFLLWKLLSLQNWELFFGKNVGNLKTRSSFSQIYVHGTWFPDTGKLLSPHLDNLLDFCPNLGKRWDIFPYNVKQGVKFGNLSWRR